MKMKKAFTLLELLIAFALAAFIMIGVIGLYNGVAAYAKKMQEQGRMQQIVLLLFRQMEQDISSAFIPDIEEPIKGAGEKAAGTKPAEGAKEEPKKEEGKPAEKEVKTQEQKDKEKKQKEELRKSFFIGQIDDRIDPLKIDGKKVDAFKFLTMICNNPLLVHEEKRPRLVRVMYELVKDKAHSTRDVDAFILVRKETVDLKNTYAKVDENARIPRDFAVKTYTVASLIKGFGIEYTGLQKDKNEQDAKQSQPKQVHSFVWPARQEQNGHVPQFVHVWIDLWNDEKTNYKRFHTVIPIFSFPTVLREDREKKKESEQDLINAKKKKMEEGAEKTKGAEKRESKVAQPQGDVGPAQQGTPPAGGDIAGALKSLMGQR